MADIDLDKDITKDVKVSTDKNGEIKGTDYLETKTVARLFGLSVRRIQQLTQEGIIETVPVMHGKRELRRYELVPTIQRYITYLSDEAYRKKKPSSDESELKERKLAAEAELKESQAELHKLRTKIATGDYVPKEQVKLEYEKFFVSFKNMAESLPSQCAGQISAHVDPTVARRCAKDMLATVNNSRAGFVVAGVGPEDVEEPKKAVKRGRKKKNPPSENKKV